MTNPSRSRVRVIQSTITAVVLAAAGAGMATLWTPHAEAQKPCPGKSCHGAPPPGTTTTTSTSTAASTTGTTTPAPTTTTAPTTTSATTAATTTTTAGTGDADRPYDAASPWNTPIGGSPTVDPLSQTYLAAVADNDLALTSDPTQYTIPVWPVDASTPTYTVKLSGYFSTYDGGDNSRVGHGFAPTISGIPVPAGATPGAGSDGQIVFWDASTGVEYGFWQWGTDASGNFIATNGYRYHTSSGYNGRFADGLAGRGDGTPYLAGLVRKWEIDQGHIDHALAFAYDSPSGAFVYPASKSDGGNFGGVTGVDLPEGAHLQLNPALTDAQLTAYGLNGAGLTIAHALQTYGAFVVDHSGSSKLYLEAGVSADWGTAVTRSMLSGIPWTQFRVVD